MMHPFRCLILTALVGGCSGAPPDSAEYPHTSDLKQQVGADLQLDLQDVEPSGSLRYANKAGDRYSWVQIYHDDKLVRTLDDRYGTYEAELPPILSRSGNIALLHQIDRNTAESPGNEVIKHERYYCTFVDVRTGCVLERRTGEFCSGNWAEASQWKKFDNTLIDIDAQRITAESVLHMKNSPADGPVWNFDNLLHCDSVTDKNRDAYSRILEQNHFSLTDDELHSARMKLGASGG